MSTATITPPPETTRAAITPQFDPAFPIDKLAESKTNPRIRRDEKKDAELRDSIKADGVHEPIIVRPHPHPTGEITHEIAAGSRRFRATRDAGLETIPVLIKPLTTAQLLELQLVENDQRLDVHPLEQAAGYAALLQQPGYNVQMVADRTGHPPEFVAQRTALLSLIPTLQEKFLNDKIGVGHATLLAPLPPQVQQQLAEESLFEEDDGFRDAEGRWVRQERVITVSELQHVIRRQVMLDLKSANWKLDDAALLPQAGPCTSCLKRTGANLLLFSDSKEEAKRGDRCLDYQCFERKADARLVQIEEQKSADGITLVRITSDWQDNAETKSIGRSHYTDIEPKQKKCPSAVQAIHVTGHEKGSIVNICTDGACKVHHPHGPRMSGGAVSGAAKPDFWEQRAKALESKIKIEIRRRAVAEVLSKPEKSFAWNLPHQTLQIIAVRMLNMGGAAPELIQALDFPTDGPGVPADLKGEKISAHDARQGLQKMINAPAKHQWAKQLPRIVIGLALEEWVKEFEPYSQPLNLDLACEAFGVDLPRITKEVGDTMRADFKARRAKAEAKKKGKVEAEKAKAAAPAKKAKAKAKNALVKK